MRTEYLDGDALIPPHSNEDFVIFDFCREIVNMFFLPDVR